MAICINSFYVKKLDVEDERAIIDNYYVYGQYLSLEGHIDNIDVSYDKLDLVLYNGSFREYDLAVDGDSDGIRFSLDKDINRGIYLDDIERGKYNLFIRALYIDEDKSDDDKKVYDYKYYRLDNDSEYDENVYYTMNKYKRKIVIDSNNRYGTLSFDVSNHKNRDVYDIVIDPGHGGVDSGTVKDKYDEASIVMDISEGIANYLEKDGFKVKLTRDKDSLDSDEYFDEYNDGGRAVISHEVYAKYLFSIHVNSSDSSKVRGIELYTASDINYDFAKGIVKGIVDSGLTKVSSKSLYKVDDGIYTHNFSEREISKAIDGYDNKGYKHYNITTNSNYLYMIRETGGIMTGAYVDDSNPDTVGVNPYYDCNRGTEAYLLELGYLTNKSDLNVLTKSRDEYAKVIADAIGGYLK